MDCIRFRSKPQIEMELSTPVMVWSYFFLFFTPIPSQTRWKFGGSSDHDAQIALNHEKKTIGH